MLVICPTYSAKISKSPRRTDSNLTCNLIVIQRSPIVVMVVNADVVCRPRYSAPSWLPITWSHPSKPNHIILAQVGMEMLPFASFERTRSVGRTRFGDGRFRILPTTSSIMRAASSCIRSSGLLNQTITPSPDRYILLRGQQRLCSGAD